MLLQKKVTNSKPYAFWVASNQKYVMITKEKVLWDREGVPFI